MTADGELEKLTAQVRRLTADVADLTRQAGERGPSASADHAAAEQRKPQFPTVEAWVRDYLLPTFPRPVNEIGAGGRWRWCEKWWRHDEAVTILTALWYAWEHAAVKPTGMVEWLPRLYYFLPILCGDDGPFRHCAPARDNSAARHDMAAIAPTAAAPAGWWTWWAEQDKA